MELARLLYLFHYSIIRASLLAQLVNKESACNAKDPSWILGSGRSAGEGIGYPLQFSWMSPVAQLVMNQPTVQETGVTSLDWKDPLEKGNGYIHQYSGLENSKDREAWQDTVQFSSVQKLSRVQLCATLWTSACQASLSITYSQSSLKLMSIESVIPSNDLILCCSHFLLLSIFPSIRVFTNESVLHIK